MEYHSTGGAKYDKSVMNRHVECWLKWRLSPLVLTEGSFIRKEVLYKQ
jgi:hypothetical protein